MRPFLVQSGFQPSKTNFVPVGAVKGVNLTTCKGDEAKALRQWYQNGPSLVDLLGMPWLSGQKPPSNADVPLDKLEPPTRDIAAPLRIPVSNVFKSQGSAGSAVSGKLCGGVVQVGERLRILPGDETALVKCDCTPLRCATSLTSMQRSKLRKKVSHGLPRDPTRLCI